MADKMQNFLLIYNHDRLELDEVIEFGEDVEAALDRYAEEEQKHGLHSKMEIVLIASDSLASIQVTHANYFPRQPPSEIMRKYLVDLDLSTD